MAADDRYKLFGSRPAMSTKLDELHRTSVEQENKIDPSQAQRNANFPLTIEIKDVAPFKDRLVALDKDKAEAMYIILRAANAQRIFEAGTSHGVSTAYLIAAMRDNIASAGLKEGSAKVYGSEYEPEKLQKAMYNLQDCFSGQQEWADIEQLGQFAILDGDVVEAIEKANIEEEYLDALLLDIWAPVALPVLQALDKSLRRGALCFIDNSRPGATRYAELHGYLNDARNGWRSVVLPFQNGFEVAVKV